MLDVTFFLTVIVLMGFWLIGFNIPDGTKNFIVGVIFLFMGIVVAAEGMQSSNTTLGEYITITDPLTNDFNVSYSPLTISSQPGTANFDYSLFFLTTFMILGGTAIMLSDPPKFITDRL